MYWHRQRRMRYIEWLSFSFHSPHIADAMRQMHLIIFQATCHRGPRLIETDRYACYAVLSMPYALAITSRDPDLARAEAQSHAYV